MWISLSTKVHLVKAMVFPVVMYESVELFKILKDVTVKVKVKVAQSCPTLCNPMDYTVHGVLKARRLEWVAFPFSRGSS